jgi:toxin-antitoxin system PIN domain toxin
VSREASTTYLLDGNALIAATVAEHEHHDRVATWLAGVESFAVCPVVEGALVRFLLRLGESSATARAVLEAVRGHPRTRFWADTVSYADVDMADVTGHRQVADAYLAALAAARGGRLATLDTALVGLRPTQTYLIP